MIVISIEDTAVRLESLSTGSEMMDFGRNKKNILQFIDSYYQNKNDYSIELLQSKYDELMATDFQKTVEIPAQTEEPESQRLSFSNWKSAFIPKAGYMITPIIIYVNVLVFLVMIAFGVHFLNPSVEALCRWGGNYRPLTTDGQWWRLLSSCFVHGGLLHLLFNMGALAYIGVLLEPKLGKSRFLSAYLLTGIASSSVSLWWNVETVSVGASGAIFGIYGIFLALLTTNFVQKKTRTALFTSIGIFVAYNLIGGVREGIDNAAHLGGLVSGILIGYALLPSLKKPEATILKFATISITSVFILLTCFGFSKNITDDTENYAIKMNDFIEMEAMALAIYQNYGYMSQVDMLNQIKNRSNYYWKENLKITEEIDEMKLPQIYLIKNEKIREYCQLHLVDFFSNFKVFFPIVIAAVQLK